MATALALLVACVPVPEHRAAYFVFGTLVEVVVRDTPAESAERAFADIQQALQDMHRDWHAWEPGVLGDINEAMALGKQVSAPPDIRELIRLSQQMERQTGGRFNAAGGGLIRLWGFHTSDFPVTGPRPPDTAIQRWLEAAPSTLDITVHNDRLASSNPAVQLDFGGIAKGYAVDRVIAMLADHGIKRALVNAGGDLRAVGATARLPWRVGIKLPGGDAVGGIPITGAAAVFTSGVDQRYRVQEGRRYPHILDPRTGQAVRGLASVTVVAEKGWFADAAATALMVAGPGEWQELASRLGLATVLVIDDSGTAFATPAMAQVLEWPDDPAYPLQIVPLEPQHKRAADG